MAQPRSTWWAQLSRSPFLLYGLPLLTLLLGDLVLTVAVVPDTIDFVTGLELAAHSVVQLLAAVSILVWLLAALALGAGGALRLLGRQWGLTARLGVILGGWLIFDGLIFSHWVTAHWTRPLIRTGAVLAGLLLVGVHVLLSRRKPGGLPAFHLAVSLVCAACIAAVWATLGTSASVFTPKYLREPTAALLLVQLQLLWTLLALRVRPEALARWRVPMLGGLLAFLAGTVVVSTLSERSRYVVATSLESARAARRLNRQVARVVPLRYLSWLRDMVGSPPRSGYREPRGGERHRCVRSGRPRVRSALLITVDALRADGYGVRPAALPVLERFRAGAVQFRHAYQAESATNGSMASLRRGRYLAAFHPAKKLHEVARELGLATVDDYLRQGPRESPDQFARRIVGTLERLRKERPGFLLHAHFLSLHLAAYKSFASHDYPAILRRIDRALGRVLAHLEGALAQQTAVVITADHGEELRSERGYFGHANDVTETLLHTPLLLRVPGLPPGVRSDPVSGVDVLPTLLEVLGARCSYPLHGRSLLLPPEPGRVLFASSAGAAYPLPVPWYSDRHMALQWPWKLVYDRGENVWALYNLARDPRQRANVVDLYPSRRAQLWQLLADYLRGTVKEYAPEGR
ncbi:MAG: sulfatase-like hydrolase/transferase [bacterium]